MIINRPKIQRALVNLLISTVSIVIMLALLELGARCFLSSKIRGESFDLPNGETFPPLRLPKLDSDLTILAAGESSMLGEPYDPKLSIPQLLGSSLQQANPGQSVAVRWAAGKGFGLDQLYPTILKELDQRPSLFLLMSGHNDFLSEFPANSSCDDRERAVTQLRSYSTLFDYLFRRINSRHLSEAPVPSLRVLLDAAVACRETVLFSEEKTLSRIRTIARHVRRLGIPVIFIAPAGNQVEFTPNRSVYSGTATAKDRFVQNIQCGRHLARIGREKEAEPRLRSALLDDPQFASAHYWLGRALLAQGATQEANQHLQIAVDNDQFPWIATSQRNMATESIAREYGIPFIDAQQLARSLAGEASDQKMLFHDVHHPSVNLYVAIANEVSKIFSGVIGVKIHSDFSQDDALEKSSFGREDWRRLLFGRVEWLRRYASFTFDRAPRLELALAMITTAAHMDDNPAVALDKREIELQLQRAWTEDIKIACGAGCDELAAYCKDAAAETGRPWEQTPFFRDGVEVGRRWLAVADRMRLENS